MDVEIPSRIRDHDIVLVLHSGIVLLDILSLSSSLIYVKYYHLHVTKYTSGSSAFKMGVSIVSIEFYRI